MAIISCKLPEPCVKDPVEPPKQPTTPFVMCAGDYSMAWDGTHARLTRERYTPDGTYGAVTIKDGCVVGYTECLVPTYTPPYCNPNPEPCHDTAPELDTVISPRSGNQLYKDNFGLFASTAIVGGLGINVSGSGTKHDPYIIAKELGDGSTKDSPIVALNPLVASENAGVVTLSLEETNVAGTVGPFTFDEFGRLTAVTDADILTSDNVSGDNEIQATTVAGTVSLGLAQSNVGAEKLRFGGYDVTISNGGRITDAKLVGSVTVGVYPFGLYDVTVDQTGVITNITRNGEQVVSLDTPNPITDMYKLILDGLQTTVTTEVYGNPIQVSAVNGVSFTVKLPNYVTSQNMIQVNGAILENFDTSTHVATFNTVPNSYIITIVIRG